MRGILILVSATVLLEACAMVASSPLSPPKIEYMDGPGATQVVFEDTPNETLKEVSTNSTNGIETPTESPSTVAEAEAEAESMLQSNDDNETEDVVATTQNPTYDEASTESQPEDMASADEPEDSKDVTTTSSVDMS